MVKGKGTQSFGKRHGRVHVLCRRCGRKTFHKTRKRCSACGFPSKRMKNYNWSLKAKNRRSQGRGRMRYIKKLRVKASNGFKYGKL